MHFKNSHLELSLSCTMIGNKNKKIAIIGLPGSGKSTFATELAKVLNIPVCHLDKHQFDGRKKRNVQEFLSFQQNTVKEKAWIIEGCSIATLEMRFIHADTVIYFHFPRLLCMWRLFKRLFFYREITINSGCAPFPNWGLLKYVWNFEMEKGKVIEKLRKQYPNVNFIILRSQKEADEYIENTASS